MTETASIHKKIPDQRKYGRYVQDLFHGIRDDIRDHGTLRSQTIGV